MPGRVSRSRKVPTPSPLMSPEQSGRLGPSPPQVVSSPLEHAADGGELDRQEPELPITPSVEIDKRVKTVRVRYVLAIVLGVAAVVAAVRYVNWHGDRAAWMTKAGVPLRSVYESALRAREELEDPLHHLLTLVWGEYISLENLEVMFGASDIEGVPLRDLEELPEMEREAYRTFAEPLVAASGDWQWVGNTVISSDM